ncbi:unnamed protein product, partial [Rotaria socialis]
VEAALNDSNSIFYYYQKLIQLRKVMPIIVRGNYDILHEDNEHIFMYKRFLEDNHEIIVACNFSQQPVTIGDSSLNERLQKNGQLLISNYNDDNINQKSNWLDFRAYESWVIELAAETK